MLAGASTLLLAIGSCLDWLATNPQLSVVGSGLRQLGILGLAVAALALPLLLLAPDRRAAVARSIGTYGAIVAGTVVVFFFLGEAFLRLAYSDGLSFSSHGGPMVARFERDFVFNRYDGPSRGPEVSGPKAHDEIRLLIQGDSITWGQGVKDEQSLYSARLLARLRADGDRVSAAVLAEPGREIDGHLEQLRKWGQEIEPDLIIYQWFINDIELDKTERPERHPVWHELFFHGFLANRSYLWFLSDYRLGLLDPERPQPYEAYMVEQFADGSIEWQRFEEQFRAWAHAAKRLTPHVLVMLYPELRPSDMVFPAFHSRMLELCRQEHVESLDLIESLDDYRDDYTKTYAGRFDEHPNAAVHERMADALYARIQELWPDLLHHRRVAQHHV